MHKVSNRRGDRGDCAVCGPDVELVGKRNSASGNYNLVCAAARRASRARSPRRVITASQRRAARLRRKYGLTVEAWDALLIAQSGLCAICSVQLRLPYTDHCHATGRVRGLLCPACNTDIARLEDPGWLELALAYLAER